MSFILSHCKQIDKPITTINYTIPEIQRQINHQHIEEIYNFELEYFNHHKTYCLNGSVSIAYDVDSRIEHLIDGQHRVTAYQRLQTDYPDRILKITIDYYEYKGIENLERIYKFVNTQMINPIAVLSIDKYRIYNETAEYLKTNFNDYVKPTNNPHKPHFNVTKLMDFMIDVDLVGKLELTSSRQLIEKIIKLNKFYSQIQPSQFKKWGIKNVQSILDKINKMSNKFFLGLYKMEWINILANCPEDMYNTINHNIEGLRIPIPIELRKKVWGCGNLNSKCYCCNEPISFTDFECGHIVPVSKGGKTVLENLRPICRNCNSDMKTMNLEEYKTLLVEGLSS